MSDAKDKLTNEELKIFNKSGVNVKLNKKIDLKRLPKHVAFIMDGNGRWAIKRGWDRTMGHKHGYARMMMLVKRCSDYGISVCSLFAFSTENWNRPQTEIDEIFRILRENMHRDSDELMRWNVRVTTMGDISRFPEDLQDTLRKVKDKTKNNTGTVLNLCANYGGRADIVQAVNKILSSGAKSITEKDFAKYLEGADLPPPDFIVRTSGEHRISNFMLWQMSYSEFYFIKPLWPDITPQLIDKCLLEYQGRKRRFGALK